MRNIVLRSTILVLGFLFVSQSANACDFCMLGQGVNPYLTATGRGLTIDASYFESDRVYNHNDQTDTNGKREGWLVYTLTGFYPVSEDLTLLVGLPYAIKTNIDYDDDTKTNPGEMVTGIGDMTLTGRYTVFTHHSLESTLLGGILFGVKLPTGSTSETDLSGAIVDRHALPGTGSVDYNLGLTTSYSVAEGYQITSDLVYGLSGQGKWGPEAHRYGDAVNFSVKGFARVWPRPSAEQSLLAVGERTVFLFTGPLVAWTGKERGTKTDAGYDANLLNPSSGGTVVYWDFGIYSTLTAATMFNFSVAKAVYHDMNYSGAYDADPAENYKVDLAVTFLF